jgi:hypothetical protein
MTDNHSAVTAAELDANFDQWSFTAKDPTTSMPYLTTVLYRCCDNDDGRFQETTRVLKAAFEAGTAALRKQLDEAREENERVRLANVDCVLHYEMARADNAKKDAALRANACRCVEDCGSDNGLPCNHWMATQALAPASQEAPASPAAEELIFGHDPQGFIDETSTGRRLAPASPSPGLTDFIASQKPLDPEFTKHADAAMWADASPSPGLDLEADAKAYRADVRLREAVIEECAKVADAHTGVSNRTSQAIARAIRALSRPVSEREGE